MHLGAAIWVQVLGSGIFLEVRRNQQEAAYFDAQHVRPMGCPKFGTHTWSPLPILDSHDVVLKGRPTGNLCLEGSETTITTIKLHNPLLDVFQDTFGW